MFCQTVVGEDEIGIHEHLGGQVVANHRGDEGACLQLHAFDKIIIEAILGIESDVRLVAADVAQIEPVIGETADEALKATAGDETLGFTSQHRVVAKLLLGCQLAQNGIGACIRQKMRETRGDGEMIISSLWLTQIQKVPRAEERLVTGQHGLVEGCFFIETALDEIIERLQRLFGDGFARGVLHKTAEQRFGVLGWRIPKQHAV